METKDITGKKYSFLTAIKFMEIRFTKGGYPRHYWQYRCDCGKLIIANKAGVTRGSTKSCGCKTGELHAIANTKHGKSRTRLYNIWIGMIHRCENKKHHIYCYYGGRGIKVCEEWHDVNAFYKWAIENGYKEGLTIDRIDVDGNYEPYNCRWATMKEQVNNSRRNVFIEYNGERLTAAQWSERLGGGKLLVSGRLLRGWSEISAVSTPVDKRRKRAI